MTQIGWIYADKNLRSSVKSVSSACCSETSSNGYTMLLAESADMIKEMKEVVNISTLSMTDHERMAVVDRVYNRLREHRNLVSYYTRKNISVSYLRAKKANDSERITALYGNANDRYW